MKTSKLVKVVVAMAVALHMTNVKAASYQLNDYSVTGLGRSYAGQGIMGDDYSAIAYNPAGMTLMKRSGVQQALSMINLKAHVHNLGGQHEKAKMDFWQPVPAGFAQYNVNDKLFLGLGIYGSYGLKTKYKSNWFGSTSAILSKLDIADLATKVDAIWIPTDNTVANNIGKVKEGLGTNKTLLIVGEEGMLSGAHLTISISYYDLGFKTAELACRILNGEKVKDVPVFYPTVETCSYIYNKANLEASGFAVSDLPSEFTWKEAK